MLQTLSQRLSQHDNDYSKLETEYYLQTGAPLVDDPYTSILHPRSAITLSANLIIPAWNASHCIEHCLLAIEQSSFNQKYHDQLEVIVVDDGSSDTTWQLLERCDLNLHLKVLHQDHHGRSQALNTAISISECDVVICCDADMLLATFAIEELMNRHQFCDEVLLLGFRTPAPPDLQLTDLPTFLQKRPSPFAGDTRITYPIGYWGLCRETNHLKQLGLGKRICRPTGWWRDLPSQVQGLLFSLRRHAFLSLQGYDEGFRGWGYEDTLFGANAIAQGNFVIPVYGAAGWHMQNQKQNPYEAFARDKHDLQGWNDYTRNQAYYSQRLQDPFPMRDPHWQKQAQERILKSHEHHSSRAHACSELDPSYYECYRNASGNPDRFGHYLFQIGRYRDAAQIFSEIRGSEKDELAATMMRGKALRMAGYYDEAIALLKNVALSHSFALTRESARISASAFIDYALALAAQSRFVEARQQLRRANEVQPDNFLLHYLLKKPSSFHLEQATMYRHQLDYTHALCAYEAALLLDPHDLSIQVQRASLLDLLEEQKRALEAQHIALMTMQLPPYPDSHALLSQAWAHLATKHLESAKLAFEQLQQMHPENSYITQNLLKLHAEAMRLHHLPLASAIIQVVQSIPGVFTDAELTFLITLIWQAATLQPGEREDIWIDANSYCGQSTVAMSMALRRIGRHNQRILAIGQPLIKPVEFGPASVLIARELFQQVLWQHGLSEQVLCVPEQRPLPRERTGRFLLIEGASCNGLPQDSTAYLATLQPESYVLAYPYSNTHPEMKEWVDALLRDEHYLLLGQVEQLIAIQVPAESGEA